MEKETQIKPHEINIQSVTNFVGEQIVKRHLTGGAVKAIGEVEILGKNFQIQFVLEPDQTKWIAGTGVHAINKPLKKLSWVQKLKNLFSSTTDAGTQK